MEETDALPGRLRLARELRGWSQAELARQVGLSGPAISQFESGANRPSADSVHRLGIALGVPSGFFSVPLEETHEGFFRSLRRSTPADRRRARATAQIAHDVVLAAPTVIPQLKVPRLPAPGLDIDVDARQAIESAAQEVRRLWGVPSGPIDNAVALLEAHGVLVIRLPLNTADVDAFSLPYDDHPVVVLGSDKDDKARSRFDAAHELGHLVLHGEHVWGLPEVEKQANYFAAAFLMPAEEIRGKLPERPDWPTLFALKQEWQVSLAALLMRARTLKRMSEAQYLTAIKAASARGWRRVEPVPLGAPEQPVLFARALDVVPEAATMLPQRALRLIRSAVA